MKDVATLIDAFHRAVATNPSFPTDLRIVGSGSLLGSLRHSASSGAAHARIHFLGDRSHEECLGLIRDARALILPSRSSEGCPNVVLEAMALGTPVIVSDLPSLTELVRDGREGAVFRRGDAHHLSSLLAGLGAHAEAWQRRAQAGRARLSERHHPATVARAYEVVYEQVLGK
jgi:glycosyltransferase involved in cell wall biosynthesis